MKIHIRALAANLRRSIENELVASLGKPLGGFIATTHCELSHFLVILSVFSNYQHSHL